MITILISMRGYLIVVLIFISLMINDVEHWSFGCLLWEKCLFKSLAHFKIDLFDFCYWVVWVICIFWMLTSYQIYGLQVFFPITLVASLFFFFCFFGWANVLVWCSSTYWHLLVVCAFGVMSAKSLPRPVSRSFFLMFSSMSFMVSGFINFMIFIKIFSNL